MVSSAGWPGGGGPAWARALEGTIANEQATTRHAHEMEFGMPECLTERQ